MKSNAVVYALASWFGLFGAIGAISATLTGRSDLGFILLVLVLLAGVVRYWHDEPQG